MSGQRIKRTVATQCDLVTEEHGADSTSCYLRHAELSTAAMPSQDMDVTTNRGACTDACSGQVVEQELFALLAEADRVATHAIIMMSPPATATAATVVASGAIHHHPATAAADDPVQMDSGPFGPQCLNEALLTQFAADTVENRHHETWCHREGNAAVVPPLQLSTLRNVKSVASECSLGSWAYVLTPHSSRPVRLATAQSGDVSHFTDTPQSSPVSSRGAGDGSGIFRRPRAVQLSNAHPPSAFQGSNSSSDAGSPICSPRVKAVVNASQNTVVARRQESPSGLPLRFTCALFLDERDTAGECSASCNGWRLQVLSLTSTMSRLFLRCLPRDVVRNLMDAKAHALRKLNRRSLQEVFRYIHEHMNSLRRCVLRGAVYLPLAVQRASARAMEYCWYTMPPELFTIM